MESKNKTVLMTVIDTILEEFVSSGAPEDILYQAMPHVGTDVLKTVF